MDSTLRLVSFLLAMLLFSCAQTGIISGGQKDSVAPRIVRISPPNLTTNFSVSTIEFEFDEFIKLNNPVENIVMLPSGIKIESEIIKKKLKLTLNGDLRPNTTYQITFNAAVKDNTEGNDSLMHYVFSTGPLLDSLTYSGFVVDAYSGERMPQVLLGLYDPQDSLLKSKPIYFCKSDSEGKFTFSYISANQYRVYAIQDLNKDLLYQLGEKAGFRNEVLDLNQSVSDSFPLLIFAEKGNPKISSKQIVSPKLLKLGANYPIDQLNFRFKDQNVVDRYSYTPDSIALLLPDFPEQQNELLIQHADHSDTVSFGASLKNNSAAVKFEVFPNNKDLSVTKESTLLFSDLITAIDSSRIHAHGKDSVAIPFRFAHTSNRLWFQFPDTCKEQITLEFAAKALTFSNETSNELIKLNYQIRAESNFSSLKIDPKNLPETAIIECISGKKVVLRIRVSDLPDSHIISFLEPGEYHFRIVFDENDNQQWDAGSISKREQSEKTLLYPDPIKLRANWETEISFGIEP